VGQADVVEADSCCVCAVSAVLVRALGDDGTWLGVLVSVGVGWRLVLPKVWILETRHLIATGVAGKSWRDCFVEEDCPDSGGAAVPGQWHFLLGGMHFRRSDRWAMVAVRGLPLSWWQTRAGVFGGARGETGGLMRTLLDMVRRAIWACLFAWHELQFGEPRRLRGQSLVETALVIAIVAVVVIPATQLLREGFASAYTLHAQALALPTTATPTP